MTQEQCNSCKDKIIEWADIEKGDITTHKDVFGRFIFWSCGSYANEDTSVIESYILNLPCKYYNPKKEAEEE